LDLVAGAATGEAHRRVHTCRIVGRYGEPSRRWKAHFDRDNTTTGLATWIGDEHINEIAVREGVRTIRARGSTGPHIERVWIERRWRMTVRDR